MTSNASAILTVNGGSSTLKLGLFDSGEALAPLARDTRSEGPSAGDGASIRQWVELHAAGRPLCAIAHRIVHGGETFERPTVLQGDVMDRLRDVVPLAPNHLPGELALVEALVRAFPAVAHVLCFDTAFHRTLPAVARTLPLPGVRRFGFHGLSYTFLLGELERIAGPQAARGRVVLAHLGSGASLAAVKNGAAIDTSMGMTPAGGLVMGTRAGDVDPGAITYLMRARGLSADDADRLLTHESGLSAIAGSGDMQVLLAREATDASAGLAVDVFCYQAAKWIGAFAVALGGLDTLVFSAGIGEHAAVVRTRILERLAFLGARIDAEANSRHAPVISSPASAVMVRIIPTDEARVMARQARDLVTTRAQVFR